MKRLITRCKVKFILTVLLFITLQNVYAQKVVTGKVVDENGEMMPGVNVLLKNSNRGTTSDSEGKFSIETSGNDDVLVFTFIGYERQEIIVGAQTTIDVNLVPDLSSLQEVVVIGYGTQKAGEVTGAIASIKSEDFQVGKIQDVTDMIKGKVAGLVLTKSSGDPNASANIMLRGVTTISGDVQPLILINGVPGDLTTVAPENVESVDVLKDASAAAIYGTRGANGVILITTKSGKRDRPVTINYTGYTSVSDFYKQADFMGPAEIRKGLTSFSMGDYDTDWVQAVTRKGYMQNHSVTIDGGTKNSSYSGNFSYRYEAGTIKKTDNDQYRLQFNLDQYVFNDVLRVNMNMLKQYHINSVNNASNDGLTNIYRQAVIRNPTIPIYTETGEYYEDFNTYQYYNPVAMINELEGENETETTYLVGNITLEPIDRWKTNLLLSNNLYNQNYSSYATSEYYSSKVNEISGYASKSYNGSKQKTLELTSTYDFTIGSHQVNALAGYAYNYWVNNGFNVYNADFPTDSYSYNNISVGAQFNAGGSGAGLGSYKNDATLISFFGRVQYAFGDKYNLLASVRREGSSKFGDNNKWGVFPAVSAGWNIHRESFMSNVTWVDNLKLRAGYGVTGRAPSNSYTSLTLYDYDADYGNFLDKDGNWVAGLMVTQNPNPELKWEKTAEVNIGVDFAVLDNRVKGSVDVYNRKTTDLIYSYSVPIPPNLHETTVANVGSLRNTGVEVMLSGSPVRTNDFEWNTTVTITHNKATLLTLSNELYETNDYLDLSSIGDPISVPSHRVEEGGTIGKFWGLKSVGLTSDGIFLVEDPNTGEAIPYSTALNSNTYYQYLGNGYAKIVLGWNNAFRYKQFDLNMQMTGQFGFMILNQQRMFYENNSIQYNRLKSAAEPVYGVRTLSPSQPQTFVSYYLEKGDYLKFDNVTLGYNFNSSRLSQHLGRTRLYVTAQNFLIITGYKGLDPELSNSNFLTPGSDSRDKYPTIRSLTVGLNITLK